jgi:outer membrane protein TolC
VAANPTRGVIPAGYEAAPNPSDPIAACDDPFAGQTELSPRPLVEEALRRNPSLEAMVSAWQAAAERDPQMISLDDPMVMLAVGPGTFGDPTHDVAWMVEGSQKIPWSGKRQLRGEKASAEADAAHWDLHDAEVRLVEAANLAFLDYYLVRRDLELNEKGLKLTSGFREDADTKYRNNLVTQQDVLQADLELNQLRLRQFELERMDRVAIARINTLLHRPVDAHLPPPPPVLLEAAPPPSIEVLQELAAERRPDLMALGAMLRAEQTAVAIAEREYYPDVTVVARYDGFWQGADRQLAPMVGVNFNVPLDNDRRCAAVREAQFRANQRRAEFESKMDEVHGDIVAAYQQVVESRRALDLFNQTFLPVAEQNIESARANYTANKIDFMRLIEAERQLITLREKREETLANYRRQLASLERASGGPLPAPPAEPIPSPHAN